MNTNIGDYKTNLINYLKSVIEIEEEFYDYIFTSLVSFVIYIIEKSITNNKILDNEFMNIDFEMDLKELIRKDIYTINFMNLIKCIINDTNNIYVEKEVIIKINYFLNNILGKLINKIDEQINKDIIIDNHKLSLIFNEVIPVELFYIIEYLFL